VCPDRIDRIALGRILGSLGRFGAALLQVNRGLKYAPLLDLPEAASHALALRVAGKPCRSIDQIHREDNHYLQRFVCPEPFKRFDIGPGGTFWFAAALAADPHRNFKAWTPSMRC